MSSFTKTVGISPMALLHLLGIMAGTGIAVWMQINAVKDSALLPACLFVNFIMLVTFFSILRNLQIGYRTGVITSASLSVFPMAVNIYALNLIDGNALYTSLYTMLIFGIFVLVVNFLVMMSGKGARVDDGRFIDESRFKNRSQSQPREEWKIPDGKAGDPYMGDKKKWKSGRKSVF